MNRQMWLKSLPLVVLIILLCIMPSILPEFYLDVMTFLLINLILVVSFRLITTMGLFSFAHISLMGIGGYTAGLLVIRLGFSFWVALPLAVLTSALVGLVIGLLCLRTRGFSFFLATFAAGEAIRWVWILFREPFGGYDGIGVIPCPDPFLGISFDSPTSYYYLVLAFSLLSLVIMYRLEKSRIGTTLNAIRLSEQLSKAIGINAYGYKNLIYVIAAAFAGLAGGLYSFYIGVAYPADYTFAYSINIIIFVIVGGLASFVGPIIGALVLTIIGEALRDFLELVPLIYGFILIVVVLLQPGGLVALPKRISSQVKKWRSRKMMGI